MPIARMNLIDYEPPLFHIPTLYVHPWNNSHKRGSKFIAHAHFIQGKNVYVENCVYCVGKLKGKDYEEQRIESQKMKQFYIQEWNKKHNKSGKTNS